jgi:MFS family permease
MLDHDFFSKARITAPASYNRWLIAPAALAIHLSIGQVYSFSVFNLPLSKLIGITESAPGDWSLAALGWIFSTAIAFLGISAALFGKWVEREGPRKAMFLAALFFSSGFLVSALGVYTHKIALLYLGYGVLGGMGLGIGYISPVSTLMKWFPDRPGMATGLAIMGFGGGAMIGSPLGVALMNAYKPSESMGVWQSFLTMAAIYLVVMMIGVALIRLPPSGYAPAGAVQPVRAQSMVASNSVTVDQAIRTRQFWLLWVVLCANVTAGIGVLGQASPMVQEMFKATPAQGAAFIVLLSVFNLLGRFFWSSASDYLGRKNTYRIFFGVGIILYSLIPTIGKAGNLVLFYAGFCVILSMYGGGFATIPSYLKDMFGTLNVGAIHGRLLTAWSVAGVLGPVLVNYLREYQITHGVAKADAYSVTMYVMVGILSIGFIANHKVRSVSSRYHHKAAESAELASVMSSPAT